MDYRAFDIFAWIRAGGEARGTSELAQMPRLASLLADQAGTLDWSARGWIERAIGGGQALMLELAASARPMLACSNCAEPVAVGLAFERTLRVVADEASAEHLDEQETEIDVIAGSRHFDLLELVEDEAILALPALARHENCEIPPQWRAGDEQHEEAAAGSLAALARFRKGGQGDVQ